MPKNGKPATARSASQKKQKKAKQQQVLVVRQAAPRPQPVALAAAPMFRYRAPDYSRGPNGGLRIRFRELSSRTGGGAVYRIPIQVASPVFGTFISNLAVNFERFVVHALRVHWVTGVPATTSGRNALSYDADPYDPWPVVSDADAIAATPFYVEGPAWQSLTTVIPHSVIHGARKELFVEQTGVTEPDFRDSYGGNVTWMNVSGTPSDQVGTLFVEYDVELILPHLTRTDASTIFTGITDNTVSTTTGYAFRDAVMTLNGVGRLGEVLQFDAATGTFTALKRFSTAVHLVFAADTSTPALVAPSTDSTCTVSGQTVGNSDESAAASWGWTGVMDFLQGQFLRWTVTAGLVAAFPFRLIFSPISSGVRGAYTTVAGAAVVRNEAPVLVERPRSAAAAGRR